MAEKEIYKLEVSVDVQDDSAKKKLSAMDKYMEKTEKKGKKLDKMKIRPSAKIEDKATSSMKKIEGSAKKLDRVKIRPTADIRDKMSGKLEGLKSRVGSFAKGAIKKFAAIGAAGALMVGGIGLSSTMQTYVDFEQGMKDVQATTMATGAELQHLTDTAKDLGKTTSFSAKEASEGMNYLAMAGFETNQIVSAMPGLLDLAAASGTDLGRTSDIVSDALTAFNLKAEDTTHLADIMAKASSTANTNVDLLGASFEYAAAPATAFGMSAEETTTALAMMANAGVKGAKGGTALRGALTRLTKPSKEASATLSDLGVSIADSHGNIKPFNEIMGDMRNGMSTLTQEQKQQAIATVFGQEAMSGMLAVLNTSTKDFDDYTKSLEGADGAAKKMAEMKLDTLGGQFEILKSSVEGAKIELGERLAPFAKQFVSWAVSNMPKITDKVVELASKATEFIPKVINLLKKISPAIKPTIAALVTLKGLSVFSKISKNASGAMRAFGLLSKGAGKLAPALAGTGKAGSVVGGILGKLGGTSATLGTSIGTVGKVSAVATKGFGGMGMAAKAGALLLNPWTIGIGAAAAGGYKFYKHMQQDAIPAVKIFGDEISDSTKKALGSYMDLNDKATIELNTLKYSGAKLTQESADSIVENFDGMGSQITEKLAENKQKYTGVLSEMLAESKTFTDEEKKNLISSVEEGYTEKEKIVEEGNRRINEIVATTLEEEGRITDEAYEEINEIQSEWQELAIENMTESQMEQAAILGEMQRQSSEISAHQAADIIRNSLEQKEEVVSDANEEYESRMRTIDAMTATGQISEETATKLIEEAERQKDETITASEEMHEKVVEGAIEAAGEHARVVDEQTGEILTKWQSLKKELDGMSFKDKVINIATKVTSKIDGFFKGKAPADSHIKAGYASGTRHASRGIHEVAEHGFEIVMGRQHREFSGGEKVLNHRESKGFLGGSNGKSNPFSLAPSNKEAPTVKPSNSSGGGDIVTIGDVEVNISSGDSNGSVEGIVELAKEEFGRELLEAIKDKG